MCGTSILTTARTLPQTIHRNVCSSRKKSTDRHVTTFFHRAIPRFLVSLAHIFIEGVTTMCNNPSLPFSFITSTYSSNWPPPPQNRPKTHKNANLRCNFPCFSWSIRIFFVIFGRKRSHTTFNLWKTSAHPWFDLRFTHRKIFTHHDVPFLTSVHTA